MAKTENYLYDSNTIEGYDEILDFCLGTSNSMYKYVQNHKHSGFILFYKYITHSDLPTFGKATSIDSLSDNLLYYIDEGAMRDIEKRTKKPFQTAHQSNIGLSKEFYSLVGLTDPRDAGDQYRIDEYIQVFIANDTVKYFNSHYTLKIFNRLNKRYDPNKWDKDKMDIYLQPGDFSPIVVSIAVHGIGVSSDYEFAKLRHNIFKGDIIALLYEYDRRTGEKKIFIMVKKNPAFFSLIGEQDIQYHLQQDNYDSELEAANMSLNDSARTTVSRKQQGAWRKQLAQEMMGYTSEPGQVFCPFTYITADYNDLGTLYVASHIKAYSDENTLPQEKYDINNGLLLSANADALFDDHLITVNQKKELVFSCLIDDELKKELALNQPIFTPILNPKRMKYLEYHESVFNSLEEQRKKQKKDY